MPNRSSSRKRRHRPFAGQRRMANWAEIKGLVEEDAHEKRKLIFSPGVSRGPGEWLTFHD